MICKKCGAQIPDNSAVCSFCGAEYEVAPTEEETATVEEEVTEIVEPETLGVDESSDEIDQILDENEKNRLMQAERLNAEKQKQLEEIAQRRKDKKTRQRRNRALVVLSIVAVAGAVAAGINHVRNPKKPDVPDIVVVSHEPTQAPPPEVVSSPGTEDIPVESDEPLIEATNDENNADVAAIGATATGTAGATGTTNTNSTGTGSTSWRATGGGGSTGSSAAGLAPSSGAGTAAGASSGSSGSSAASGSTSRNSAGTSAQAGGTSSATSSASGSAPSSSGGYNGNSFKSALITGGDVTNSGNGNIMSFTYDGKTYYAKVSSNTTSSSVNGKPMTITATKTNETYNGAPVYAITEITRYDGDYIFPESGYKALTTSDLEGKTAWELKVARNEIYARHGRTFKDKELQAYFNSCSWYKPNPNYNTADDSANLNATELKNAYFILDYEKTHQ